MALLDVSVINVLLRKASGGQQVQLGLTFPPQIVVLVVPWSLEVAAGHWTPHQVWGLIPLIPGLTSLPSHKQERINTLSGRTAHYQQDTTWSDWAIMYQCTMLPLPYHCCHWFQLEKEKWCLWEILFPEMLGVLRWGEGGVRCGDLTGPPWGFTSSAFWNSSSPVWSSWPCFTWFSTTSRRWFSLVLTLVFSLS